MLWGECKREEGCECVGWGEELNWVMKRITETLLRMKPSCLSKLETVPNFKFQAS